MIGTGSRRWIWYAAAFVGLLLLASGSIYWWSIQRAGATALDSEVSGEVPALDPRQVARGEALYQSNCLQCHGVRGKGHPNWGQQNPDDTYPPPPHDSTGHTWHHADGLLYRIVQDGGTIYETPGFKSAMPAFGDRLTDDEIRDVIAYIKSLWEPEHRESQAEVSRQDPFP